MFWTDYIYFASLLFSPLQDISDWPFYLETIDSTIVLGAGTNVCYSFFYNGVSSTDNNRISPTSLQGIYHGKKKKGKDVKTCPCNGSAASLQQQEKLRFVCPCSAKIVPYPPATATRIATKLVSLKQLESAAFVSTSKRQTDNAAHTSSLSPGPA